MKRDMELIRLLLIKLEGEIDVNLSEYTSEEINYHNYLLLDAGLSKGKITSTLGSRQPKAILTSLTWEGHEFLDAAKYEPVWKNSLKKVAKSGGAFTFDILKAILTAELKERIGV